MSNQSSVEWLASNLDKYISPGNQIAVYALVEQAKTMHEKEIKKAWEEGFSFSSPYQSAKIYYNETFKTK